ncbi:tumor necrosis factor ligand superfamily member 11 [Danio aesculapii]|uniref:tumor necrosis factor ligand superfamily member 11 n=1 Tax=Danio aesculapii TaxID=1142201 RepID=UPI0024C05C7B|nr:tumor necrosis factor ligand superfamily member 11 [Danio aesculapii]
MAANDYRAYLRNHIDMEEAPARAPHTGSTHRALIFGTLAVMALLQVASSVAILLHLTGYLREVDLASPQQSPNEEMHSETLIGDQLKSLKKERCRTKKVMPSAHLPIKAPIILLLKDQNGLTQIAWDDTQVQNLKRMKYSENRIIVDDPGYYYVYAKTCFRYHEIHNLEREDISKIELGQYIYHENNSRPEPPTLLAKSSGTPKWNTEKYNKYCMEQGRGVRLEKDDRIYVKVSNARLLDPAVEETYFGSFKISD